MQEPAATCAWPIGLFFEALLRVIHLTHKPVPLENKGVNHPLPRTLVQALRQLPRGKSRGFRFISPDRAEKYHSFEDLESEAYLRAALFSGAGLEKGDRLALVIPD